MTTEKACRNLAIFAVAAMGGKIHVSTEVARELSGYSTAVKDCLVTDMKEAWRLSAYVIERPFYGDNKHGWRLCRYCNGSGQADVSPMFLTRQAFADAMRTVSAMANQVHS